MKDGFKDIIGKRVVNVIVAESPISPRNQVFIVFDDNTYFELYGENFACAGGVDRGDAEAALEYVARCGGTATAIYPASDAAFY